MPFNNLPARITGAKHLLAVIILLLSIAMELTAVRAQVAESHACSVAVYGVADK